MVKVQKPTPRSLVKKTNVLVLNKVAIFKKQDSDSSLDNMKAKPNAADGECQLGQRMRKMLVMKPPQEQAIKKQPQRAAKKQLPTPKQQDETAPKKVLPKAVTADKISIMAKAKTNSKKPSATKKSMPEAKTSEKLPPKAEKIGAAVANNAVSNAIDLDQEIDTKNIVQIVEALQIILKEAKNESKAVSIIDEYRYHLNVVSFKIPNCPRRMVKLNLKHSLVASTDSVAIIVCDLVRGSHVNYDDTIEHYTDLFNKYGVKGVTIIPMRKLKNEISTFEAIRKFRSTYDYFLCDRRIVGHATGILGKIFQTARTTLHTVRMNKADNLKSEIAKSLCRTAYKQLKKGDLISIPVGNHEHQISEIADNIRYVIEQLKTLYPGGVENIRSILLKIDLTGTPSLPLYESLAAGPAQSPNVIGPREQRMHKLKKEANSILEKFALTKEGCLTKLNKEQQERKRKMKAVRLAIGSKDKAEGDEHYSGDDEMPDSHAAPEDTPILPEQKGKGDVDGAPTENDGDENPVPAKKPRKEDQNPGADKSEKKKDVEEKPSTDDNDGHDDDDDIDDDDDDDDDDTESDIDDDDDDEDEDDDEDDADPELDDDDDENDDDDHGDGDGDEDEEDEGKDEDKDESNN